MKKLGSSLMILGALVGVGASIWIAAGLDTFALPWLVSIGLVKLTIGSSLAMMGAGAAMTRLANRRRNRLESGQDSR